MKIRTSLACFISFVMTGCTTITKNEILKVPQQHSMGTNYPTNYSFASWVKARGGKVPDPAIVLSFSGGIMRAAGLANGTLRALSHYTVTVCAQGVGVTRTNCHQESLLDHVVAISSTSGGSFANANFVLNGPESFDAFDGLNEDGSELSDGFLERNLFHNALGQLAGHPWKLSTTVGPFAQRSPLLVSVLNDAFPRTATPDDPRTEFQFRDIPASRPYAIFEATDYISERQFSFTQNNFRDICSDISRYPVMDAVAASSALPIVLTDVELRNHWADDCPMQAANETGSKLGDSYFDEIGFLNRRYAYALQHSGTAVGGEPPYHPETFIHLFDGGLVDNLAIFPMITDILTEDNLKGIFAGKSILFIEVNAQSAPPNEHAKSSGSPGVVGLVEGVPYISVDTDVALVNFAAHQYWSDLFNRYRAGGTPFADSMYFAEINFDQYLELPDPDKNNLRDQGRLKNMTGLSLSHDDVRLLRSAAQNLLENHPCFKALLGNQKFEFRKDGAPVQPVDYIRNCILVQHPNTPTRGVAPRKLSDKAFPARSEAQAAPHAIYVKNDKYHFSSGVEAPQSRDA